VTTDTCASIRGSSAETVGITLLEGTANATNTAALPVLTGLTRGTAHTGPSSCVAGLALPAIAEAPGNDGAAEAEAIAIPGTTDIGWRNSATRNAQSRAVGSIGGTFTGSSRLTKDRVA